MARRRIVVSSSGGISPGSPFVLNGALFVQQANPPFAFTQRLGALIDAGQSIVAPGLLAGATSFVVGSGSVDAVGGDHSVIVGNAITQIGAAGQASRQILIGSDITFPAIALNAQGTIIIGASPTISPFAAAPTVGSNVLIGDEITLLGFNLGGGDPQNNVVIGASAFSTGGGSVVIGTAARAFDATSVAIGQSAKGGAQSVAIGLNADATAAHSISIGDRARAGSADTIAIGWFADAANSDSSIAIGREANTNAKFANIMLGRNASVALDNHCQVGGDLTYPINTFRFGAGYEQATGGVSYTFGTTEVNGAPNTQGNSLVIQAGHGTGNWNGGSRGIDFQVGLVQGSGATAQPYTSILALHHSNLGIALWGGLGATFGSGVKVMFIGNATTVPTVAPVGGALLYVDPATGFVHILSANNVNTVIAP